ncbi:MAG TPA: GMP synthase subunit A [Candidatus Thermoplasmatota archaeon]|nr:GMP synthase subunit A [Candidatus Thermoplasmatota archaeon]
MKVYVVDNGGQWTHREWRVLKYLGVDTKIVPHDTSVASLQAENVDGLVLSGGAPRVGLADALGNCGLYIEALPVPIVGICAGHQFMARHFGGEATPGGSEFGQATIKLHEPSPRDIFKGLPPESTAWESHHDEVSRVPKDFEVLASSEKCKVQAMRHRSRPLFGLQFHPEVEHTQFGATIFQNFLTICESHKKKALAR